MPLRWSLFCRLVCLLLFFSTQKKRNSPRSLILSVVRAGHESQSGLFLLSLYLYIYIYTNHIEWDRCDWKITHPQQSSRCPKNSEWLKWMLWGPLGGIWSPSLLRVFLLQPIMVEWKNDFGPGIVRFDSFGSWYYPLMSLKRIPERARRSRETSQKKAKKNSIQECSLSLSQQWLFLDDVFLRFHPSMSMPTRISS